MGVTKSWTWAEWLNNNNNKSSVVWNHAARDAVMDSIMRYLISLFYNQRLIWNAVNIFIYSWSVSMTIKRQSEASVCNTENTTMEKLVVLPDFKLMIKKLASLVRIGNHCLLVSKVEHFLIFRPKLHVYILNGWNLVIKSHNRASEDHFICQAVRKGIVTLRAKCYLLQFYYSH